MTNIRSCLNRIFCVQAKKRMDDKLLNYHRLKTKMIVQKKEVQKNRFYSQQKKLKNM